jgi:hypothetical protein
MECLARYGVDARAQNTIFKCCCPSIALTYIAGADDRVKRRYLTKAKELKIGTPYGLQGFAGHVVVIAGGWLLDPTFDQASVPNRGLVIPAQVLALPLEPQCDLTRIHVTGNVVLANGLQLDVEYASLPDRGFMKTPAWTVNLSDPIGEICTAMEAVCETSSGYV